jgi:hypothetical protein
LSEYLNYPAAKVSARICKPLDWPLALTLR